MNVVNLLFRSGPLRNQNLKFQTYVILGRHPANTVVLNDPSVSARHCKIFSAGGQTFLQDLNSSNGTTVNDLPIEMTELHSGDLIVIGETLIEVQLTPAPANKPAPPVEAPAPESGYADHDSAPVDVSRRNLATAPEAPDVAGKVEAAPAPLSDLSPKDTPLIIGSGGPAAFSLRSQRLDYGGVGPQTGTPASESVAVESNDRLSIPPNTPVDDHAKRIASPETQVPVEDRQAKNDFAHVDVSRRSFSTEPNVSEVVAIVEAAPSPLDSESKVARAPLPQDTPHRFLPRPAMFPKWSRNPKSKIILAVTCGLVLLLGVGFGLRYALRSKPQNAAQPTKRVSPKPKPKPEPTWNDMLKTFKPEGDKDQQAKQRIAFLKGLVRRFPKDQPNVLSAYLDIARQYEQLNEPKQAIRYFEEFLGKAGRDDNRRSACMAALIRALLAGGRTDAAMSVFDGFCEEKPAEASAEAERICTAVRAGGRAERTAELAAEFAARLLRHSGEAQKGEQDRILALSRDERWARTELWMGQVKERIPWNNNDEQTMLIGILGGMRSVDCFVKAVLTNERLIGEGCDVSGRFEDHSYIIACQYPCKADQLLSWYGKTGFEEYRTAAAGFIRKMHRLYISSRDGSGGNWLPIGQFVGADGKAYDYGNAPKLERGRDIFPWDQSRSSHNTHHLYMDAWGLGIWELAKSAALLEPADRQLLVELLKGQLDFFHRPYMLKNEGDLYYWRTDAFCPLAPPAVIPAPNWETLGVDVIHAVLALNELDADTRPWQESMRKFAAYYMRERTNNNARDKLVEYTDLRAMDLADYLEKVCGDKTLRRWLQRNIPTLYEKRNKDVGLVINGGLLVYSPLPVMELMARFEPGQYRRMLNRLMLDHVTPYGLYQDGAYPTINESEHEAILDSAIGAWRQGVIPSGDFRDDVEKMFLMWGNPRCYRDAEDWVLEPYPYQRQRRAWEATPYAGYPENARPEAYYKGLPHAYTLSYIYAPSIGTFETEDFNCLVQYTSPGGQHTERLRYGRMATFNIMDTRSQSSSVISEKDGRKFIEVECVMPDVPAGTPCVGIVKVTAQYYRNESWHEPTGYRVREVLHAGRRIPFKVYGMFGYMEPPAEKYGNRDNVKTGFLLRATKPGQKEKVQIVFAKPS